jgi:hypothetical protein
MAMLLCGTFHYTGVVPDTKDARESGEWKLAQLSDGAPLTSEILQEWKQLRDSRLVGLEPILRVSGSHLILEARRQPLATIHSASLELDRSLLEIFQSGDVLTVVRNCSADLAVSLLRHGQLVVAIGAATATPLGAGLSVHAEDVSDDPDDPREFLMRHGRWVDVSVWGDTVRLGPGETRVISDCKVTVLRCVQDGVPGNSESLAISREGICPHDAALRSAELIATGVRMVEWPTTRSAGFASPDSAAQLGFVADSDANH